MSKSQNHRAKSAGSSFADGIGKWFLSLKGKYQDYNDKFFEDLDQLTLDEAIQRYRGYQRLLWYCPLIIWFIEIILFFWPFTTLDHQILTLLIELACIINLIGVNNVNWFLINLLTRQPNKYKEDRLTDIEKVLKVRNIQRSLTVGGALNTIAIFTVIPYYEFLRANPDLQGWTPRMTDAVNGNDFLLKLLIASLPIFITYNFYQLENRTAETYREQLENGITSKEFHNAKLRNMLSGQTQKQRKINKHLPIMVIGTSQQTGDLVTQSVTTRRQNSVYFGAVGSGKSKTIFSYQMYQDLQKLIEWLRDFPKISKEPGFMTKKGNVATQYLNGVALIDPTNDQTKDTYDLARTMGIPDDEIIWFDPSNPRTKGLNLMRGPAEKVAEDLTNVIAGVQESSQDFFHEAGRNHLKNYVYLLKITSVLSDHIPTLADLKDMYDSPYVVRKRQKVLDAYLQVLEGKLEKSKEVYDQDKDNDDKRTDYYELRDKYKIAESTASWFKLNIIPNRKGNTVVKRTDPEVQALDDKDPDKWEYIDAQAEFVRGLSNTLDDISKNIGLRRVLFRDSGEFNLDDAMYRGKVLLFNTDKEHVGAQLATTLGQIYLGALEAATLRRTNNAVPMFPIYMDEFVDYADVNFLTFSAQSRKFAVPLCICSQSPGQMEKVFGQDGIKTFFDDFLTVGTFGNMSPDSAEFFERFFGTKQQAVRSTNEQQVGLLKGMDDNRRMVTTRMQDVPNISANELMAMDKFTVAVRTPSPEGVHGAMLFNTVRTDYVNLKDVAENPNNFDVNDPDDEKGINAVLNAKGVANPDLDAVDKQIRQEYLNKTFTFELNTNGAKVTYNGNKPHHDMNQVFGKQKNNAKTADNLFNLPDNTVKTTLNDNSKSDQNNSNNTADSNIDLSDGNALLNAVFGDNGTLTDSNSKKPTDKGNKDQDKGNDDDDMLDLPKSPDLNNPPASGGASQKSKPDLSEKPDNSNKADASDNDEIIHDLLDDSNSDDSDSFFGNDTNSKTDNSSFAFADDDPMENQKILDKVVDANGKHGGNNRTKRDISEAPFFPNDSEVAQKETKATTPVESQPTSPSQPTMPKAKDETINMPNIVGSTNSKQGASEEPKGSQQKPEGHLKKPETTQKEDDGMLKLDSSGKIQEDNTAHEARKERYLKRQLNNRVDEATQGLIADAKEEIGILLGRKDMTPQQKIAGLKHTEFSYKSMFDNIDPHGMPTELKRIFNQQLKKLQKEADADITLGGKNTQQKLNEIQHNKELMDSLRRLFNQQEDPDMEVDLNNNKFIRNAKRDNDFNQKDPFYTQPGMEDDDQ